MSRDHVEFIQSQQLPWQPTPWPHLAGTSFKPLSHDPDSGATTALLRFEPGWSRRSTGRLEATEEWLVLEGELQLDDVLLRQDCYTCRPAGCVSHAVSSTTGALVVAFYDAAVRWMMAGTPAGGRAAAAPVVLDAFEMPWACAGMDPAYGDVGLRWKLLRGGPGQPDMTMLVSCPPHLHPPQWRGPQERHDCVEEMFLISGDYLSNVGTMRAGAYFWRPPGIAHGPYGTRSGNLAVIRTLGAPLENNWTEQQVEISRDPPLATTVPGDLRRAVASSDWRPPSY